ncbi:hypothetical protein POM88_035247 [Heracleum sosnowskyi]|uniref:Uncharacterized protein n=1 Tax=Heracleum sosnowskyi TaxID=360622 RepID=A0AAD8HKV6_9APIA|nr:hypothetical protein POM88_035247 [Heracleum sosnowskyi]
MNSEEVSSTQQGEDNQELSEKKITASEVAVERIIENTRQDVERNQPAAETELTNQVTETMSRDTATVISPATDAMVTTEVIRNDSIRKSPHTIHSSGDDEVSNCRASCAGCAMCVLCIPFMLLGTVVNCLLCPVDCVINCCCPSQALVNLPAFNQWRADLG